MFLYNQSNKKFRLKSKQTGVANTVKKAFMWLLLLVYQLII